MAAANTAAERNSRARSATVSSCRASVRIRTAGKLCRFSRPGRLQAAGSCKSSAYFPAPRWLKCCSAQHSTAGADLHEGEQIGVRLRAAAARPQMQRHLHPSELVRSDQRGRTAPTHLQGRVPTAREKTRVKLVGGRYAQGVHLGACHVAHQEAAHHQLSGDLQLSIEGFLGVQDPDTVIRCHLALSASVDSGSRDCRSCLEVRQTASGVPLAQTCTRYMQSICNTRSRKPSCAHQL